jgi:H+/gluconate symporter-like permease
MKAAFDLIGNPIVALFITVVVAVFVLGARSRRTRGELPDWRVFMDRGRESAGSPYLRTGQALFTHPALQLMGSNSETEVFEF